MFKVITGDAPPYLTSKFVINDARHTHKIMVLFPRINIYKSSFTYAGGCLWNDLSSSIPIPNSLHSFKKQYVKFLFDTYQT